MILGLPGLSWDQKDTSMCVPPFPHSVSHQPVPKGLMCSGTFPAGKGWSAPQEISVDVSCSSLGQEQPIQEAAKELHLLPCLLRWKKE